MAILATEKVLTLDYWKPASQVEEGDYVFNQLGELVKVTLVQQYRAEKCYQVTFDDHLSISGDEKLNLPYESYKYRVRMLTYKGVHKFRRPLGNMSLDELKDRQLTGLPQTKTVSIPTAHPLKLPHQTLPVPPFVFGFWFFNRKTNGQCIFVKNFKPVIEEKFKDHGYKLKIGRIIQTGQRYFSPIPSIESQLVPNVPTKIPNNYLLASQEQRIELLQGILASRSRQYVHTKDTFRISGKNLRLLTQIQFLAESLGCRTSLRHFPSRDHYGLYFRSKIDLVPNQRPKPIKIQYGRRYPKLVEQLPAQTCVYIETNGGANHILVGEGLIPCR